jgi:hypothetical protein
MTSEAIMKVGMKRWCLGELHACSNEPGLQSLQQVESSKGHQGCELGVMKRVGDELREGGGAVLVGVSGGWSGQ